MGRQLTIITQTKDSDTALKLVINWDDYNRDGNLFIVENTLEVIPKIKEKGTILTIEKLRDRWSSASIQRVYRYVSDIITPIFPIEDTLEIEEEKDKFVVDFFEVNQGKNKKSLTTILCYTSMQWLS